MNLENLREATDDDSWPLIALVSACWAEYPGCVIDIAGEYPEMLAPASHYRSIGGALWVVPDGTWIGACVGLCPGHAQPLELVKLYVAQHRRGQGLGRALVAWVEEQARQRGATGLELWSDTRFDDAHRLYRRCGFEPTGSSRHLYDRSATVEYEFEKLLATG